MYGAIFAQDLCEHDRVDEYRLVIHPVVLGTGFALFGSAVGQIDPGLESSSPFAPGIIATFTERIKNDKFYGHNYKFKDQKNESPVSCNGS